MSKIKYIEVLDTGRRTYRYEANDARITDGNLLIIEKDAEVVAFFNFNNVINITVKRDSK